MPEIDEVDDERLAPHIWVRVASEIVRSYVRGRPLEPRAETISWLNDLESTALEAIRARDNG